MNTPHRFRSLGCALALLTTAAAQHGHGANDASSRKQPKFPGLVLPDVDGPTPWSSKPILDDPDRFHIAIMTDRTGGHRPGIWMRAVSQLNQLRPDFVMSVGDLIEGYTTDLEQLETEWKEFLGFIDQLEMKFFFVAGNHDVTNPTMHRLWRDKFGPEYYSFDYRGVHFLCLSSEEPKTKIGDRQLAWIERDLAANRGARWTLVYLHKPLWTTAERELKAGNPDPTNWKKVEALLGDRPHTVFAGHVHHYVQYDRNGHKYYSFATTGGVSRLRGLHYGEFDHIVWLTMESDGPRIANLLVDGVKSADVVTEASYQRFRKFLADSMVEVAPILIADSQSLSRGAIHVRLTNAFDVPVRLTGEIRGLPLRGLTMKSQALELTAAPGRTEELDLHFELDEPVALSHFAGTALEASLATVESEPDARVLTAELTQPVTIDQRYTCARRAVTVDGDPSEWGELTHRFPEPPLLLGADRQWNDRNDANAAFDVASDPRSLYFVARVQDDRITARDRILIALDARRMEARLRQPQLRGESFWIELTPSIEGDSSALVRDKDGTPVTTGTVACRPAEGGYWIEVAFSREAVTLGPDKEHFMLTVMLDDFDDPEDQRCSVVWRGTRDARERNTNFGYFFLAR